MYRQTDNLRFEKYPFRAVCGGNIGFHKSLFERAGEFDEAFKAWGKEDTEWGFRVWNRGDYIIPLYEACGLHMEPPGGRNETDRELGLEEVMPIFVDRVPVMYRKHEHGVSHSVPLVSVYIPAYNAEDSIVETVNSALGQTFEDIEVCIAVDGSKDGTLKQLERHFLDNPRVRWVCQENQGIGGASNSAVQLCRGVFIGQLDSDDVLLPEAVEIMLEHIQRETRLGVVYGSFQKETPEGEFLEDGYEWPEYSREKLMHGCIVHHFRMFRARDWWRTQGFATDIKNAVDYDMFLKMSEVTEMKHVREWSYVYRIHEKSTSVSDRAKQIGNHFIAIERSLNRRGLASRWLVKQLGGEDSTRANFVEKKNWDKGSDTTTPFARMEAKMREAAPPVVRRLARMEGNKKPWTVYGFPSERISERLHAFAESIGVDASSQTISAIVEKYGNNLWSAFEEMRLLENGESDHN
jgi:chondroitin synthase